MKSAMKQSTLVLLLNVISSVFLIAIVIFFSFIVVQNQEIQKANLDRFDLTYNANRFLNGSSYLTNEVRAYAATSNMNRYDNYWNEINNLKNRDIGIENMKKIGITEEEQKMIDEMSALSNKLVPLEEKAMQDAAQGNITEALTFVFGDSYEKELAEINAIKARFLSSIDDHSEQKIESISNVINTLQIIVYALIVAIILIQFANYILVRRKVVKPIIKIQAEMGEMAEGNLSSVFEMEADTSEVGMLTNSIHVTKRELKSIVSDAARLLGQMATGNFDVSSQAIYKADFSPLEQSINTIIISLSDALRQINEASYQVSSGSEQVASGAQALSQGTTEQASSLEELSATISQISNQIKQNAEHAKQANQFCTETSEETELGNQKMQDMIRAMEEITNNSNEIGKIIKTIDDIAFQTNILALNAAVEAARAGAAGKGFAVVADEVRNLAGKSAEAAKSTTALIENAIKAVENGTTIADDTAKSLLLIVEKSKGLSESIRQIAAASVEQSTAVNSVTLGVEQISSVVQANSATAEQSAAASEELSAQAAMLKTLAGNFKLKKGKME